MDQKLLANQTMINVGDEFYHIVKTHMTIFNLKI